MATILVVDDDADYRDLLRTFLETKGHTALVAHDVKSALALYSQHSPAIVISDILMPETDGIEFLMRIKKSATHSPGIIMISGGGMADPSPYLGMAQSLGATRVFAKPLSLKELDKAIREVLDKIVS